MNYFNSKLLIASSCFVIFACQREVNFNQESIDKESFSHSEISQKMIGEITENSLGEFYIPKNFNGTIKHQPETGGISFTFSENYLYLIYGDNMESKAINGGFTVYCICEDTGTCNAATNGEVIRCFSMDQTCQRCKPKKIMDNNTPHASTEPAGFIELSSGVKYARYGDKIPTAFGAMLNYTFVEQAIYDFLETENLQPVNADFQGKYVVLNVFGRALAIKVKEDHPIFSNKAVVIGERIDCVCPISTKCTITLRGSWEVCTGGCGPIQCGLHVGDELYNSFFR